MKPMLKAVDDQKTCMRCNSFFSLIMDEPAAFGICLNNPVFDPYIEDILENMDMTRCADLIEAHKFNGNDFFCEDYELMKSYEIDDDNPLGQQLNDLVMQQKNTPQKIVQVMLDDPDSIDGLLDQIDWKNAPITKQARALSGADPKEQKKAVDSLHAYVAMGNMTARNELLRFFCQLPPPVTVEDAHFKLELLQKIAPYDRDFDLLPDLVRELYEVESNNATRRWMSGIFKRLRLAPYHRLKPALEEMLTSKHFSHRLKARIRETLDYAEETYLYEHHVH